MLYPTITELTKGEYNRYELTLATARCARLVTDEYVKQREDAEKAQTGNKETDKPLNALIDREVRDEKAVKIAIGRIHNGDYRIVHKEEEDIIEEEPEEEPEIIPANFMFDDEDEDDEEAVEGEDIVEE